MKNGSISLLLSITAQQNKKILEMSEEFSEYFNFLSINELDEVLI